MTNNQETPLISVIIPYYKGQRFIDEALNSVFKQNYSNLEIIIVNDGSPIETLDILNKFKDKIKIISQENMGQSAARNTGIKNAKGSIIALLDQDDIWSDDHISSMLPYLLIDGGYDFVRGHTQIFYTDKNDINTNDTSLFYEVILGSAMHRRSVFDKVGMFDEDVFDGEDADWNLRLRESDCKEKRVPNITLFYRKHDNNRSMQNDSIRKGAFLVIRRKIQRARIITDK